MNESQKVHPVISYPHQYIVVHLSWNLDPEDYRNNYLDIHFKKREELVKIRFIQPVQLNIEDGFYGNICGMEILDISKYQLDSINIEVRNSEQDAGITFKAKDAIILT